MTVQADTKSTEAKHEMVSLMSLQNRSLKPVWN